MLERELADLPVDPRAVDGDWTRPGTEARDDGSDRGVVELDPVELRQDRLLPHVVAQAGALAPVRTRSRVELAVAAVGERPVAPEPASADAFEQALEEVDPV